MTDLKVVPLRQGDYQDPVCALKELIRLIETGEVTAIEVGTVILRCKDGEIETFALGQKAEPLSVVGLLEMGKSVIIEAALYPEPQ
ncbi:hypothetical protein [Metapseudomonas sp. CR1201]